MRAGQVVMADGEFGGRPADQHGDGVFVLRAQHADIDGLRLRVFDLGLCRGYIGARDRTTGVELILHDLERAFIFHDRAGEEIAQGNPPPQIEIGGGEQGLLGQFDVGEIGGARLRGGGIGLDLPAHLAPDVEVPGAIQRRRVSRGVGATPAAATTTGAEALRRRR